MLLRLGGLRQPGCSTGVAPEMSWRQRCFALRLVTFADKRGDARAAYRLKYSKVDTSLLHLAVEQLHSMDKFKVCRRSHCRRDMKQFMNFLVVQAPRDKMVCIGNSCRVAWAFRSFE